MKQTARRTGGLESKVKAEAKVKPDPIVKSEPKIKPERKPKPEPKFKREHSPPPHSSPRHAAFPSSSSSSSLGLINGIYDISCPYVTEQWYCEDLTITLAMDGQLVWGSYDFGMFSGIFLLQNRPYNEDLGKPLPVQWRGRENGEGEMTTGDDNEGHITFLGNGRIEGSLRIMGSFDFEGQKSAAQSNGQGGMMARSMRAEWDSYNEEAYEYERVNRWR